MRVARGSAHPIGALIALSVSTFIYVTTETLPIGLLQLISGDLHTSLSAIGLLVTCYGLVVVVASIPLTHLTRRVPRRTLLSGLLGIFVVATFVSAVASNYGVLLGARIVTALSQALFWSIVVPTAAGLFSPRVRGRVLAMVFGGSSLAAVLGVPAGTWFGQLAGWRTSFVALSVIGLLALAGVARLLPGDRPGQSESMLGTTPDARRFWLLMVSTVLAVTGSFVMFTYVSPFLTGVTRLSLATVGPLLFVRGVAGIVGVFVGGPLVDWSPWTALMIPVVVQAAALLGLYEFGGRPVVAVVLVALSGLAFAAMTTALSSRVLQLAPGSVDLAAAGASTAVNVGITAGAFIGSVLLPWAGVRSTTLVGGLLSVAALAVVLGERLLPAGPAQPAAAPDTKQKLEPGRPLVGTADRQVRR